MRASFVANKSSVSFQDNRAPGDHSHPCSDKFVHIQAGCRWGGAGLHERRTEICGGYFLLFIFFSELAPRPRTFPILSSYIRIGAADFAAPSPFRLIHYPHQVLQYDLALHSVARVATGHPHSRLPSGLISCWQNR